MSIHNLCKSQNKIWYLLHWICKMYFLSCFSTESLGPVLFPHCFCTLGKKKLYTENLPNGIVEYGLFNLNFTIQVSVTQEEGECILMNEIWDVPNLDFVCELWHLCWWYNPKSELLLWFVHLFTLVYFAPRGSWICNNRRGKIIHYPSHWYSSKGNNHGGFR